MKDRESTYPGRVKLTPVEGQTNIYDMERADEPSVEGSPLNKANLLPDTVARLLGLDPASDPQIRDALSALGQNGMGQAITAFAVDETKESVSITATLENGAKDVIILSFDAEGRAVNISVNDRNVPVTWTGGDA